MEDKKDNTNEETKKKNPLGVVFTIVIIVIAFIKFASNL